MTISPTLLALSGALMGISAPPATSAAATDIAFADLDPVADAILDQAHGMALGPSRAGLLRTVATQRSRDDAEFIGAIGQTQMDVWWSTEGAQLIAASVRAAPVR